MAKKKDDLSAIRKSMARKETKPSKDLEAIKQLAKATAETKKEELKLKQEAKEDYKRTTISISISTYKKAKKHCIDVGTNFSAFITDLIEEKLS